MTLPDLLGRQAWTTTAIAACAILVVCLGAHAVKYPDFSSFWAGVDQRRYLDAAKAFASLDLSPRRQHYPPYYPLLGAAFSWLTPWQPFMIPDAACLAACLLLFVRIGRSLAPGWPGPVVILCFLVAVFGGRMLLAVWIVPWSTTGSAPFQFASLLLALRFAERASLARACALGCAIGVVAGFRPSDSVVLLVGCGWYVIAALAHARACPSAWGRTALAGAVGLAAGALPAVLAHVAVFGIAPGPYVRESMSIGFEWRLLPLRWVMLVLDPRPLLPSGTGIAERLPWLVPGVAGMILGLLPRPGYRAGPAALVAATVMLHWAAYLCYRDMQPYGLWRFYNIHYFKWTFPFIVLWAAKLLPALLVKPQRKHALIAFAATLPLLPWRPVPRSRAAAPTIMAGGIVLQEAPRLYQAVQLPLSGAWTDLYFGKFELRDQGQVFVGKRDFKVLPVPDGALLVPLRTFPLGPATLIVPADVRVTLPSVTAMISQRIVFGLP